MPQLTTKFRCPCGGIARLIVKQTKTSVCAETKNCDKCGKFYGAKGLTGLEQIED